MDKHFWNEVKGLIEHEVNRSPVSRWGTVQSVNPNNATCTVMIHPDEVLSGQLPIKCLAAGPVNVIALPSVGDQVQLHADCGSADNMVVSMAAHGGDIVPPVSPATGMVPQPGEVFIGLGSGAYLHLTANGIFSGGNWTHAGLITATANITAGQGTGDQIDMLHHTHKYIPGSGTLTDTQPPTPGT